MGQEQETMSSGWEFRKTGLPAVTRLGCRADRAGKQRWLLPNIRRARNCPALTCPS